MRQHHPLCLKMGENLLNILTSEELESELAATVKRIVEQALFIFKEQVQKEVRVLKNTIVTLTRYYIQFLNWKKKNWIIFQYSRAQ